MSFGVLDALDSCFRLRFRNENRESSDILQFVKQKQEFIATEAQIEFSLPKKFFFSLVLLAHFCLYRGFGALAAQRLSMNTECCVGFVWLVLS